MSMAKVYETVFSASVVLAVFYPFFVYWRTYVAFRLLGTRVEQLGLAWFSFEFQLPNFAKQCQAMWTISTIFLPTSRTELLRFEVKSTSRKSSRRVGR